MARILDTVAAPRSAIASPGAFVGLAKPKEIPPHLLTAGAAMFLAVDGTPPLATLVVTLLGGGCVAAAANVLNCVADREIDARMPRTRERPLPSGRVGEGPAIVFAAALGLGGASLLAWRVNVPAAAMALIALVYYAVAYTLWLKRRTRWSSLAGSAIGAIPPLVGWVAVTDRIEPAPFALGALVVLWTIPHFWSLALARREEYARAGLNVLPERGVGMGVAASSLALVASSLALAPAAGLGALYFGAACALGAPLLCLAIPVKGRGSEGAARRLFGYSIVYIGGLFGAMIVDAIIRIP